MAVVVRRDGVPLDERARAAETQLLCIERGEHHRMAQP